jgi:hypothetical protein
MMVTIIFVGISMVLAVWNLLYNNLLMNIRFWIKMKSIGVGMVCYDGINLCQCSCFLESICRDQCFTVLTSIKWLFKAAVMITTIVMIGQVNAAYDETFVVGAVYEPFTRLDTLLIVYLLQHPFFILARIPIFLVYAILTCCCGKGEDVSEEHDYSEYIIALGYRKF